MYRIDDLSASATLPVPEAAGPEGYWTEGNPASGVPATVERASWFNMIQEELRAIVVAGGLVPSKTSYNQILTALQKLYGSGRAGHVFTGSDWVPLPGGLILQWGQLNVNHTGGISTNYTFTFPTAFPNAMLQGWISPGNNIATASQPVVGSVEGFGPANCTGYVYSPDTINRIWRILVIGY
jgi:hypothetical protein